MFVSFGPLLRASKRIHILSTFSAKFSGVALSPSSTCRLVRSFDLGNISATKFTQVGYSHSRELHIFSIDVGYFSTCAYLLVYHMFSSA